MAKGLRKSAILIENFLPFVKASLKVVMITLGERIVDYMIAGAEPTHASLVTMEESVKVKSSDITNFSLE